MGMFGSSGKRQRILRAEEAAVAKHFHGSVGGVVFDFRHPLLSPISRWACPSLISSPPPGHPGFHVVGDLDSEEPILGALGDGVPTVGSLARDGLEVARDKGLDVLFPGDRVEVANVDLVRIDGEVFALDIDREAARLDLEVARAGSGEREPLTRIWMLPRGSMAKGFRELDTLSLLLERTQALVELGTPDALDAAQLSTALTELHAAVNKALNDRADRLEELDAWQNFLTDPTFDLYRLVNLAALYGYRQGSLEADVSMAPLARGALARRAGDSRGQQRATEKRVSWQGPALELAVRVVANDPTTSNRALARQIRRELRAKVDSIPEAERVTEVVSEWRRTGRLSPRGMKT